MGGVEAHSSVKAKLREWLDAEGGLRDWDISRDAPYFGFEIPGAPGKFFYVWLDAPIGYLTALQALCERNGLDFDALLAADSVAELHHFLGKDIVNFHGLFWPAVLNGANIKMPTALHVNGYLTVNGAKMSKSRGTFIQARTYLDAGLDPECLRYYFAAKIGAGMDDLDLNLDDFVARVDSDLVGKFVNIASRAAGFITKYFDGRLNAFVAEVQFPSETPEHWGDQWTTLIGSMDEQIKDFYKKGEYADVVRSVMKEADNVNRYWHNAEPWKIAKDDSRQQELHSICSNCLRSFFVLALYLAPIVPALTRKIYGLFEIQNEPSFEWARDPQCLPTKIRPYEHLFTRIDPKHIEAMTTASTEHLEATPSPQPSPAKGGGSEASASPSPKHMDVRVPQAQDAHERPSLISIDDFAKLDLRIGTVLECGFVGGSDKLLRFLLDAGELGQRQIFSGIRAAYAEPERLVGRKVVFIANLAPRKMRFGISEGMILSAGSGGDDLHLLDVDAGALPGMPVK